MKKLIILFSSIFLIQFSAQTLAVNCKVWGNIEVARKFGLKSAKSSTNSIYSAMAIKEILLENGYKNVDIISLAERDRVKKDHHGKYVVIACE